MVRPAPQTRTCRECGVVLTSHKGTTTRCAACRDKAKRPIKLCPDCGAPVVNNDQRSVRCRSCWKAQHPDRFCVACNAKLPVNSHRDRQFCHGCWDASRERRTCSDCGERLASGSRGTRCRPCWLAVKLEQAGAKSCAVFGCDRPYRAKGFCITHYLIDRRDKMGLHQGTVGAEKSWVGRQPCQLCGYDKMRSDVHRIIPGKDGGTYTLGNMTALCARCHAEVHRGIATCPAPLIPTH